MRLFLAFLLAAVGMQAVPSGDLPIDRDHGSAFSASSIDSAVARQVDRITTEIVGQPVPPADRDGTVSRRLAVIVAGHGWYAAPTAVLPMLTVAAPPYMPRPPPRT